MALLLLTFLCFHILVYNVRSLAIPTSSIVTGASGYVGRAIVHELLAHNDDEQSNSNIVCLVRATRVSQEQDYWKSEECVTVMAYDMLDGGATLKAALDYTSTDDNNSSQPLVCVYHVASVFGPTEDPRQTALDNVQGTRDLCRVLGEISSNSSSIRCRLVLTSSMAAVRGSGQEPGNGQFYTHLDWNTQSELGANWGSSYQWSKAESERVARESCNALHVPMTSLCPSFVFGPPHATSSKEGSKSYSIELVGQWVRGQSPVQSRLFVDVRDVAAAHVAAGRISEDCFGGRYILSLESRIPSEEIARWLADVNEHDAETIHFDGDFSGGAIPIGEKEVEAVARLDEELGIRLRPVKSTIVDMASAILGNT